MSSRQEQVEKLLGNKKGLSELKSRILFVVGALIVFRMGSFFYGSKVTIDIPVQFELRR